MLPRLLAVSLLFASAADSDIYHGKKDGAKKPAEIKAQDVFNEIAEYKKIKEKGLTKDDAEYWVLLNKANEKFNKAVKKVAEDGKHDVVAEKGKVKFDSTPVDITKKVIEALKTK
jgi:Skp family chaperone for outer membrane proteins